MIHKKCLIEKYLLQNSTSSSCSNDFKNFLCTLVINLYLFCEMLAFLVQNAGLILGLPPANERRHYKVTLSLIGWAQT